MNILTSINTNRKRSLFALIILFSLFLGSILIKDPDFPYGICFFRTLTGIPCPACGMTHSFISIGQLKISEGFHYNILGPILYLLLIVGIVILFAEIITNRLIIQPLFEKFQRPILLVVIPLVILSWIINIVRHYGLY
ncbi:MAG: DUF2752 domain-containing protein [Deltaproteobacteria bacterium]|nr:DUF2752 domain-containing protein [Deltaproteobacteria bacterium]